MDKKRVFGFILGGAIVIAAVVLRLLYINTDLWYDEACSWFTASKDFPLGIMNNLLTLDLQHTPLYFFLLHFWMKIFGESEVTLRVLSVIFGIASVPIAFCVSKKLFSNTIALLSTFIIAVSPVLCFFSVEVRMYPMVMFLVLLSLNYLVDFEQKEINLKNSIKLVIANLLIPYTFVGGIFYNLALWICCGRYFFKSNRDKFKHYMYCTIAEIICLIPYFALLIYYAKMRSIFVIKHEGPLAFFAIVEVIRNFFGATLVDNLYWATANSYSIDFMFAALVVIPCVYFIYGIVQGIKKSDGFLNTLYQTFILIFIFSIISALLQINVFTIRYVIYILPPLFILSIGGLSKRIRPLHLKIFTLYFVICAICFNVYYAGHSKALKTSAFRAVQYESKELNLNADDILILPFGSDAPYYFRTADTPRIINLDFHKNARNPYNSLFYDKEQQAVLAGKEKYDLIYNELFQDKVFSDNFFNYFIENVNMTVPHGRYAVIALLGEDAQSLVTLEDIRELAKNEKGVNEDNIVGLLFKKFMFDIRFMLSKDFIPVKTYTKGSYTYIIYQKP